MFLRYPALLVLAGFAACDHALPAPEMIHLAAARDTVLAPYNEITDAAWLTDDRWVLIAPNEPAVVVVDFASGTVSPFGDPAAFNQPFSIFRFGDSLYIGDWARAQLTVWSLDGRLLDSVPASAAVAGHLPRGRDGEGRFYVQSNPSPGPDGRGLLDSSYVVRGPADFATIDTVAQLAPRDVVEVNGATGRRFEPRLLSGTDLWGAESDGSVWVARVDQNRVQWVRPEGSKVKGSGLPDPVLTVEEGDRRLFLNEFPEELRSNAAEIPFAIIKPPFTGAMTAPDGHVWLRKTAAYTDTTRTVQNVDRDGRLAAHYSFPGYGQLMAAGRERILVVETWKQGVRLLRYDLDRTVAIPVADTTATE